MGVSAEFLPEFDLEMALSLIHILNRVRTEFGMAGDESVAASEENSGVAVVHGLNAVSYTHLDVYKRQIECHQWPRAGEGSGTRFYLRLAAGRSLLRGGAGNY